MRSGLILVPIFKITHMTNSLQTANCWSLSLTVYFSKKDDIFLHFLYENKPHVHTASCQRKGSKVWWVWITFLTDIYDLQMRNPSDFPSNSTIWLTFVASEMSWRGTTGWIGIQQIETCMFPSWLTATVLMIPQFPLDQHFMIINLQNWHSHQPQLYFMPMLKQCG